MNIATLIRDRLNETGQSKTSVAKELGITRPTLETWLRGAIPEPESDRARSLAGWLGLSDAELVILILAERGVDVSILRDMTRRKVAKEAVENATAGKHHFRIVGLPTHSDLPVAA